jgi:hypothetical protein
MRKFLVNRCWIALMAGLLFLNQALQGLRSLYVMAMIQIADLLFLNQVLINAGGAQNILTLVTFSMRGYGLGSSPEL